MGAKRGKRVGCRELGEELRKSRKGQGEEGRVSRDPWLFCSQVVGLPARYISYFCSYVEVVWNDEVAIQVQRNKVLIEEEQVELSLVDENVDVEHFLQ